MGLQSTTALSGVRNGGSIFHATRSRQKISYQKIRDLTSPEEERQKRRCLYANLPLRELVEISTEDNVRDSYLGVGKKLTPVHAAIRETLVNNPEDFITKNGGLTITCTEIAVDDKKKIAVLTEPSIINGAQTSSILHAFRDTLDASEVPDIHVRVEIQVLERDIIGETSIARNNTTQVAQISRMGAQHQLDEMEIRFEKVMRQHGEPARIRKRETDVVGTAGFVSTEKLIQVCSTMMPADMLNMMGKTKSRASGYSRSGGCMKDFSNAFERRESPAWADVYRFFVEFAPHAWMEYRRWRHHPGFDGKFMKNGYGVTRDSQGNIESVNDGLVFPIMGSLSNFVVRTPDKGWHISKPDWFDENNLIERAIQMLREDYHATAHEMGRDRRSYETLYKDIRQQIELVNKICKKY